MPNKLNRTREHPPTALHGGGGERVPADRETLFPGYDATKENKG